MEFGPSYKQLNYNQLRVYTGARIHVCVSAENVEENTFQPKKSYILLLSANRSSFSDL